MQHHQSIAAMFLVVDVAAWQRGGIVINGNNGIEGGRMTRGYVVGVISGSSSAGAGADSSCVCVAFIRIAAVVISITATAIAVVVGVDGRVAPSILLHLLLSSRFIQRARKYNRYRIV